MYSQDGRSQIRYGSQIAVTQVLGTTYSFQDVGQYFSQYGRFLSDSDNRTRRRVAVVAEQTREDLGLPENPVGEFIQVNGEWLRIIGVPEPKGEILGQPLDERVLIPYSTMASMLGNRRSPDIQIQLTVADLNEMDAIVVLIARLLRSAHNLEPAGPDDFRIQTAEQLRATFDTIIDNVTIAMAGIVGISLLVGGIGIMNIMLVSVTERTREIGICKAIGAKRHHILLQFLLEALVLCLLGGVAGTHHRVRDRSGGGIVHSRFPTGAHAAMGDRAGAWILCRRRCRIRYFAGSESRESGSDQLAAIRVIDRFDSPDATRGQSVFPLPRSPGRLIARIGERGGGSPGLSRTG